MRYFLLSCVAILVLAGSDAGAQILSNGDFDGAVGHFDRSAELGQQLDLEEPLLFGISHTATTLMSMTRFEEGWQKAQEARQLAERLGNRKYLAEVLTQPYVDYHVSRGDLLAAKEAAEEGLAIATPIGASIAESLAGAVSMRRRWRILSS